MRLQRGLILHAKDAIWYKLTGVSAQIAFIQNLRWHFYDIFVCVFHAGVWASKLGEMAGVKVPLIAMHHAYVVTERIEGIQVGPPSV